MGRSFAFLAPATLAGKLHGGNRPKRLTTEWEVGLAEEPRIKRTVICEREEEREET